MAVTVKVDTLVDALRTRIQSGEFGDDKLPSFRELSNEYDTTQETMNKAMQQLQAEGALISKGTKGVFVNKQRIRLPGMVPDFYEDILKNEKDPINDFITKPEIIEADENLAKKMHIKKGDKVIRRIRKQGNKDLPFRIVDAYFPVSLLNKEIIKHIFEDPNFHVITAIKKFSGTTITCSHEELFARLPDTLEQKQLGIVRINPIIETKVTHFAEDKKTVVFYTRKILNANLFLLTFNYSLDYWK